MQARRKWQGVLTVARFNWRYYVAAFLLAILSLVGWLLLPMTSLRILCGITFAAAGWFVLGSLGVSHLVYDWSALYRWTWLNRALDRTNLRQAILCHCGFDEVSAMLCQQLHGVEWRILDHFDPAQMTEPSIRRARAMFPPAPGTQTSRYDGWPLVADSADAVLGVLAIHELRSEPERCAWFAEAKRCLRADGRVLLVEHVRDAANFAAFGPGFLHFHSPASWRRCWESAGLRSADAFRVTPFVRVFVLFKT